VVLDRRPRSLTISYTTAGASSLRLHLIHVTGYNRGLIMRLLTGAGTPRAFQARLSACPAAVILPNDGTMLLLIVVAGDQTAAIALSLEAYRLG
jgi:hypothetical protein